MLGCWCSPDHCHAEVLHELAGNTPVHEYERDASSINVEVSPLTPTSSTLNTEAVSSSSTYVQASSPTSSPSPPHSGDSLLTSPSTAFDLKSLVERLSCRILLVCIINDALPVLFQDVLRTNLYLSATLVWINRQIQPVQVVVLQITCIFVSCLLAYLESS